MITKSSDSKSARLPLGGELFYAPTKRFKETIVFVHHYGGSKRTVKRHVRFVNELGYDAVAFNLLYHEASGPILRPPITSRGRIGAYRVWAEQLQAVVSQIPGRKIIYSFSMPSNGVVRVAADNEDVVAWICDGGPFLQLKDCVRNLYTKEYGIKNELLLRVLNPVAIFLCGFGIEKFIADASATLAKRKFPILSLRSANDQLVPESAIEEYFSHAKSLNVEKYMLAGARHLEGYKVQTALYRQLVEEFLKSVSSVF